MEVFKKGVGLTMCCKGLWPAVASFGILLSRNGLVLCHGSLPVVKGGPKPLSTGVSHPPRYDGFWVVHFLVK